MEILGVKVNSNMTIQKVLEKIKSFLLSDRQNYIVTLNPEMAVKAQKDEYFRKIINQADLVIADGIGILWALDFLERKECFYGKGDWKSDSSPDKGVLGVRSVERALYNLFVFICFVISFLKLFAFPRDGKNILNHRLHGVDLIYEICKSDFIKDRKIYLLGAEKGIVKKAAEALLSKYPYLNIVGAEEGIPQTIFSFQFSIFNKIPNPKLVPERHGESQIPDKISNPRSLSRTSIQYPISNIDKINQLNNDLIQRVNKAQPDILFVAFGAPKQEKWIYEHLKEMPSVKLAMGVGGAFDFMSSKTRRAPLIFQNFGLEWLWRLILQPWRIKRIYNATVKFAWMVWRNRVK